MANETRARTRLDRGGVTLGRLFGIEIRLHFTVLIIFGLILFSLGAVTFPSWHPDWDPLLTWGLAFATAVMFWVSLLAHEMAHSLVGRARGMVINRITLFLFGGMAEMGSQPRTPGIEFQVAIAGPLMSVAIGVGSLALAGVMLPAGFADAFNADPQAALALLGPLPTLLLWLGLINLFLAAFNMVPGFPLDGGRVLRSILWAITKDLRRATRWAANAGKGVAFLLMGYGLLLFLYGALIDGIWLLFIAWFLYGAARNAYADTVLRHQLGRLTVGDLMDTSFHTAHGEDTVESFARELAHRPQRLWPVESQGRVAGLLDLEQVASVPEERRTGTSLMQVMTPLDGTPVLSPEDHGQKAMDALANSEAGVALVTRDGRVVGLLSHQDVLRWLSLFARDARA
jgi:Zn-dependent protease/predicted transcriptional regulator